MDIVIGNGNSRKESVARHPIIAVAIVVRHEPFVAPEPMRTVPWKARRKCRIGKTLIETSRRRAARQAHREDAVARLCETAKPFGNIVRERFSALESPILGRCGDDHYATTFVCNVLISNSCDGGRIIAGTEYCRSGDNRVCACGDGQGGIFAILPAVDLDPRVKSL